MSWSKLGNNFYKLKSNGSSFGNPGMSGGCGIVQNSKCDIIVGYARSYGIGTNNCAKFHAMLDGQRLFKAMRIESFVWILFI